MYAFPPPKIRIQIAAASGADPRTVRKFYERPNDCSELSKRAISAALRSLGLPDPHGKGAVVSKQ